MNSFKIKIRMRNSRSYCFIYRRFMSAIHTTGDKTKDNSFVLQPYMNISKILNNSEEMKENIRNRKLNIDFEVVKKKFDIYRKILDVKTKLENIRDLNVNQLRELTSNDSVGNQPKIDTLKENGRQIRNKLKELKENLHFSQDDFVRDFLHFPNKLHPKCPIEHYKILYRQGLPVESLNEKEECHLNRKHLIDFKDSSCYYLLNEAAMFDFEFSLNCTNFIIKNGYTQMVNPDFSRKVLLEAVYSNNIKEYEEIKEHDHTIKSNSLHLNGGGSFTSFLGFVTKFSIYPSVLPIKLVSLGRQYCNKGNETTQARGLFSAIQSNAVQIFIATTDEKSADAEMEAILNLAVDIYKKLGIHFRIIYEKATEILSSESLKASIQMFSPHFKEYIEVGHISNYSDYVSKRLLFNIKEGKNFKFPYVIGGPIINVSKILGCLVENNADLKRPYFKPAKSAVNSFKSLFEV